MAKLKPCSLPEESEIDGHFSHDPEMTTQPCLRLKACLPGGGVRLSLPCALMVRNDHA
jgi:hypothetical protein